MINTQSEEDFKKELLEEELRWEIEEDRRLERAQLEKEFENYEPIYPY